MPYQDKDRKNLRGIFPPESRASQRQVESDRSNASQQYYAIASTNELVRRFEIIQGNGKRYSFSYATLPIFIQEDSSRLFIKSYELLVTLTGRNLDPIHAHLNNEVLTWAKASPSGKDDGTASTFIKEILVDGEAINEHI